VPNGLLKGEDLGPKLDKADKSFAAWKKVKDPDKEDAAKRKAATDGRAAAAAGKNYLAILEAAVKANKNDKTLHRALYDLETVLAMQVLEQLGKRNELVGVR